MTVFCHACGKPLSTFESEANWYYLTDCECKKEGDFEHIERSMITKDKHPLCEECHIKREEMLYPQKEEATN